MPDLVVRTISSPVASSAAGLIKVAGEIDITSAPALRAHLQALPDRDVVLDMSGVTLLSAAGLTVLLDLQDRLALAGARLMLADIAAPARRILTVTGLDDRLVITATVDDAIAQLTAATVARPRLTLVPKPRSCGGRRTRSAR
jgi:anti-sigma B factor antagonist